MSPFRAPGLTYKSDLAISRIAGHVKEELDVLAGRVLPIAVNSWWGLGKTMFCGMCCSTVREGGGADRGEEVTSLLEWNIFDTAAPFAVPGLVL